jgi:hypothetical protein
MNFLAKLLHYFNLNYKSILENYIESRNPTSTAEIDFYTREFERKHFASWNY